MVVTHRNMFIVSRVIYTDEYLSLIYSVIITLESVSEV